MQEGDLLGDGVNVAARIQAIAEPGGICISGSVYDQIQNKLTLQFKALGDQNFKNIAQPIRTFTITHGEGGSLPVARRRSTRISALAIGITAVVIGALGAGGYWFYRDNEARRLEQDTLTAQLAQEKQATADARRAAEEQGRRAAEAETTAERGRLAAEAAKREATLQAQAQAADEARRRNDAERRRLDEERLRLETEKRANAAALEALKAAGSARARAQAERVATSVAPATATGATTTPPAKVAAGGSNRFDGIYEGRLCSVPDDSSKRICWQVSLKVENGIATATWASRVRGKSAVLHATVAPDGVVKATINGWNPKDGTPLAAAMDGRVVDNHIGIVGQWANGGRMEGRLTRLP